MDQSLSGILTIVIVEGKDIRFNTFLGNPNPYVILKIGSVKFQTEICEKQEKPIWNCRFAVDLSKFHYNDEIRFELYDYNPYISDTMISFWSDSLKNITQIQRAVRVLDLAELNIKKQINGKLKVSFEYYNDGQKSQEQSSIKENQEVISSYNAEGVLRISILNGTKLKRSKDTQFGSVQIESIQQQTKKFKQENPTLNQKFLMKCQPLKDKNIEIKFSLKNYFSSNDIDVDVGSIMQNLDQLSLVANKPKCVQKNFTDNNIPSSAALMCEYTFLKNSFTREPKGIVRIKIEKVNNINLKKAFYTFQNSNQLCKFYIEGPTFYLDTNSVLDEIKFNLYINKDLLEVQMNKEEFSQLEPECTVSLVLAELNWLQNKDDEVEREAVTTLNFITNKVATKVSLSLVHRNEQTWSKFQKEYDPLVASFKRQKTIEPNEKTPLNIQKHESNQQQKQSQFSNKQPNLIASSKEGPKKKSVVNVKEDIDGGNFTKLSQNTLKQDNQPKQVYEGLNLFCVIKGIQINGINLEDLGKTNLFLEVSIPTLNYRCFTSVCDNPYKFEWQTNIPINFINYIDKDAIPATVKIYELYVNPNQVDNEVIPSKYNEIMSFTLNPLHLEIPTVLIQQYGLARNTISSIDIKSPVLSQNFMFLFKKVLSQKNKSFDQFQKSLTQNGTLKIKYTQNKSLFIDQPLGILSIDCIQGENIQYTNRDIINSLLVFEVNNQIAKTDEHINNLKNPKYQKSIKFFTNSILDTLKIKFFDFSNNASILMFKIFQRIADLPLVNTDFPNTWKIPLSTLNQEIEGNFVFTFSYTPINSHPFYKQIQNGSELNEKLFWVERYEKRDGSVKGITQVVISTQSLEITGGPKDTHAQITLKSKNSTYISQKIRLSKNTNTYNNIKENFRLNLNAFDLEEQNIDVSCTFMYSKDDKNFTVNGILNGQLEWTRYPLKKYKTNYIQVELKKINFKGAINDSLNQITLIVDVVDSFSIENYENVLLNIRPLKIKNINQTNPLNDLFLKTSCQYVLKLFINKKDQVNQFFYAMPGTIESTTDVKSVTFLPSSLTYYSTPFRVQSLQSIIVQESKDIIDRQMSFGDRICSFFTTNLNVQINIELVQITDMTVKHPLNIDYMQLDQCSMPILKGQICFSDILNFLNEKDQTQNFAIKMLKQIHPNLISAGEANTSRLGIKQEEIVFVFSADFNLCPKRLQSQLNLKMEGENEQQNKQQQSNEEIKMVKEMKDGLIQIQVEGLHGINNSSNQSTISSETEATIYSNQIIFKQLDQEGLSKLTFKKKQQQYSISQDETSEYFRNDEAPFNQLAQLIFHPEQNNVSISLIKNLIEFISLDKSKRYLRRKQLQSFSINLDSLNWFTNQTISMSILLQNDLLYRSAVLNLNLSFIQNRFTSNFDCTIILKSFEIMDIKEKDFQKSLSFNFYIQGFDTEEDSFQQIISHSNNSYPIIKEFSKFKQSYQSSKILPATEFKQTDTGYIYTQSLNLKCQSIFDTLTIDFCDTSKTDTGLISKCKLPLYNIKFPQVSQEEEKKQEEEEQQNISQEEDIQDDDNQNNNTNSQQKMLRNNFLERKIKTIVEHGLKKFNEEQIQKNIEVEFFLVMFNSVNIIKRIPCKVVLEFFKGEVNNQPQSTISLANIAKIKGKLTNVREKLYKIYYYDSKMNAYEFNQQFRKKFKGMSLLYLRERFSGMNKQYNNPDFKKELTQYSKDGEYLWHITIPQGTTLQIKGSIKMKYSFNISLIIQQNVKNSTPLKLFAQFKRDAYSFKEERGDDGDEIEMTEITLNQEIDFYIPGEVMKNSSQIMLGFKYMDKEGNIKLEEGEIPKHSIQQTIQSINSPEDLFQTQQLLIFIRPSNFRVITLLRVITSPFYKQNVGEISVQIHRIIRVEQNEMLDTRGLNSVIRYKDKKIIAKNYFSDKISVFALSNMKLKVKVNGQKEFTNFIDSDGSILQNEFKTHKFLTSHPSDKIELKLVMTGQSKEQLNKIMRNISQEQSEEIEEAKDIGEDEEVKQENNDDFLREDRSINLCKGSFQIVDVVYSKPQGEEFFFIQPLRELIYHNNDVMKQFYNILNRKDIYVLGSFKFQPIHWAKVFMKIDGIKNIQLNPEHHLIQQIIKKIDEDNERYKDDLIYFGVKLKTMVYYNDYSTDVINEHSTSLLEITLENFIESQLNSKAISFQFDTPENFSVVYRQQDDIENIAIEVMLVMMFEGKEYELCQRLYPVKKMCEQKYLNNVMSLNLELNEQCNTSVSSNDIIKLKNAKQIPIVISRIQARQEIKIKRNQNEFDKLVVEKKEKKNVENEKLNFRKTTLLDMIQNLLSSSQRKVTLQIIKEIQELILYVDYSEYKQHVKTTVITLMNFIRVYYDDYEIVQQCLANMSNLAAQDINQFIDIFKANNGLAICQDLAEMLSKIKLLHINQIDENQEEKKNKVQSKEKKSTLIIDYRSKKLDISSSMTITTEQLKQESYKQEDLLNIILNNRLRYVETQKDENGLFQQNSKYVRNQSDFELLEYSQKDDFLRSKGIQTLQLLKLLDFYMERSVQNVIECNQLIKIIDELLIESLGKVKNLVKLYSMISTKVLSMTIDEESEKILGLDIFANFLITLCSSASNMNSEDTLLALKTVCKLFRYIGYKKDFGYISKTYNQYFSFVFSLIGTKKITRYVLSEIIDQLVQDITVISQDPQNIIKKKFSQLVDEKNLLRQLEKVLDEELLDSYVLAEDEKEIFNEDIIIENCFKFLTMLAREFEYPADEFLGIESILKQRQKTVKKPKRKATIENFLSFLFNKAQGLDNLNKYDINKRKKELLEKKKQDFLSDPVKLKNELATKYLISRLDWK
ncbi:C2 domain protein (macronuclear) [Tetrahymena thermophila SB210]|uniref:C2 domain protein n=1 Tax=Tetrahymena thermophila (strain SB210) TaxID=312017 RepID=Q238S1_TETTS|nr:C2 domain protein [Tetrahymena thermophila SB210]EAR93149.2 C2 domain protein [Tetrahymena thermophila SB210]|eukprot:XP_001013394.2 C2 domain protein [Tetrahymena thermophila SB210]